MKKTVTAFLTLLCISLLCGTILAGCNSDTQGPKHIHTYATKWAFDDMYHWHDCTVENCSEASDKAQHTFENDVCTVCGYENGHATSANEVTEEQFNAAVTFDGITSMTVQFTGSGYGQLSTTYFDGKNTKVYSNGMTMYVEDCDTFIYYYSCDSEHNKWYRDKIEKNDEEYSTLPTFERWKVEFGSFDFADFSYTDGFYIGTHSFDYGNGIENFKFRFDNGKLVSAYSELKTEDSIDKSEITFSEYNSTTVTLPEDYEDIGGTPQDPTPSSAWASYFDFDNVTATQTIDSSISTEMSCKSVESIQVSGKKWIWCCKYDYFCENTLYNSESSTVYFDGTNAYENGSVNDVMNCKKDAFFINADFSAYESFFIESSPGIFEAREINDNGFIYKNVRITVDSGRIVSINMSAEFSLDGVSNTETISYHFTNWGQTEIDGTKYTKSSLWAFYLDLDNVTIVETMTYDKNGTKIDSDFQTTWKIDGNAWICCKDTLAVDGKIMEVTTAYFDGTNSYLNGVLTSEVGWYHYCYEGFLGDWEYIEDCFEKNTQGTTVIYSADIITLNGYTYKGVQIDVKNECISSITYKGDVTYVFVNGDDTDTYIYPATFTFTFLDHGKTVIDYTPQ